MHCVYVDNELVETDLTVEEALELEQDILDEDPDVEIRIAPMNEDFEDTEEYEDDEEGELEDDE